MEFLELIETVQADAASVQRLFNGEDGVGIRTGGRRRSPGYQKRLAEAARFVADVFTGKRPAYQLREAMSTSDFPNLFGDIIDRQLLAAYRDAPSTWQNFVKRARVRDFRSVKRLSVYGGDDRLTQITKQHEEYPESKMNENSPYTYAVAKYGRRMPFSWETIINDDLDALRDIPQRFGRSARRTESYFAISLFVDANGPHASFYTTANKNRIHTENGAATNNPALSISGLQMAMQVLAKQVDEQGEPIFVETVELVVPPALEITAQNVLNALTIELAEAGATANQKLIVANWMKNRVRLNTEYYIPTVASTANGSTSWFLFANPNNGRPALEVGFLTGHEEPEVFMKAPNAVRVGGGAAGVMEGDFDTDDIMYKVRHVLGGTRMDPKMTVASNGSGA